MRKLVTILIAFQLITGLNSLYAQTVDDVINKYIDAMGGKEKVNGIKSLYTEGVTVMQNGNELTIKSWKVQDKLYRNEFQGGMFSVTTIITDKEGWRTNPRNNNAYEAIPADRVKSQQFELDINPLVDYAAKGHTVELIGKEAVNGVECYKIKLTPKSGNAVTYYIDPNTWYLVRESRTGGMPGGGGAAGGGGGQRPGGGDGTFNRDFSNYQKTEQGYLFPFTVSMGGPGSLTYEKIEVNKPIDDKLYKPQ
jgi:hypothetical protein